MRALDEDLGHVGLRWMALRSVAAHLRAHGHRLVALALGGHEAPRVLGLARHDVLAERGEAPLDQAIRIYERGEALQYLRSFLRLFYTLSPNINEFSFNLIHAKGNPVANHSMSAFRGGLEARAKVAKTQTLPVGDLPGDPDCECYRERRPEYRAPDAAACQASAGVVGR